MCVLLTSLAERASAQAPPFPTLQLADIPNTIPDGASYQIAGTVTGIANGEIVTVTINNYYPVNGIGKNVEITYYIPVSVSPQSGYGSFLAPEYFTFHGGGTYYVTATYTKNNIVYSDVENGNVLPP